MSAKGIAYEVSALALLHQQRRDRRSAPRRHVEERRRGEACEATIDVLAVDDVGRGIEHSIGDDEPAIHDAGIRLARQRYPFLHDVRLTQGGAQCLAPRGIVNLPPENDSLPSVLVIRLEDELFLVLDDELHEIDGGAVVRGAPLLDDSSPWDIRRDHLALLWRKERGVALVGEHGETGFLVENLAGERIHHADGALTHCADDGVVRSAPLDELADEHSLVNEVDRRPVERQLPAAKFSVSRIDDDASNALTLRVLLEERELPTRRYIEPVEHGDAR